MISVYGASWITNQQFGTVAKKLIGTYRGSRDLYSILMEKGIIKSSMKSFGRFDQVSKNTCLAISLALHDGDINYSEKNMQDVGILSTNEKGCLESNVKYFKDYVDCGRTLSRGNLFIYTLPSTPVSEAAINFGCQGPVSYSTFKEDQTNHILEQGRLLIEANEAKELLIVNASDKEAICFYLKNENSSTKSKCVDLADVQHLIKNSKILSDVIKNISQKDSCLFGNREVKQGDG